MAISAATAATAATAAGLLLLAAFPLSGKVAAGRTPLHSPVFWMAGAIFVYFFIVSGGMYLIIKKVPLFLRHPSDPRRALFFYPGAEQLGAEGFAAGFLFTVVGVLLGLVTQFLVRVRNPAMQRATMYVAIVCSFLAVREVVVLDNWKGGGSFSGAVEVVKKENDQHIFIPNCGPCNNAYQVLKRGRQAFSPTRQCSRRCSTQPHPQDKNLSTALHSLNSRGEGRPWKRGRRLMIGSTAPTCTYNECRDCKSRCRTEKIPVDANDPINGAYRYRCVCHR